MFVKPKNRFHAFLVHIVISAIIFIILAFIIIWFWYPGFLFATDGGWNGIRLIAAIDFIIGPILTLIIYKVDKPNLKFDLCFIAFIQFSCLTFGTWTVYQERPVAVIYADGKYYAKSQVAMEIHGVKMDQIKKFSTSIPAWIYINLPDNQTEREKILNNQIFEGLIYAQVYRFQPYKKNLDKIRKEAMDITTVDDDIKASLSDNGIIYPYTARYGSGLIEIDSTTGSFVKIH
ncbi:MAG: hypothetical protein MI865_04515 [Proteobacteria bacterium]|nr:hypothetical protein [Pseudomonadota bacterium]